MSRVVVFKPLFSRKGGCEAGRRGVGVMRAWQRKGEEDAE